MHRRFVNASRNHPSAAPRSKNFAHMALTVGRPRRAEKRSAFRRRTVAGYVVGDVGRCERLARRWRKALRFSALRGRPTVNAIRAKNFDADKARRCTPMHADSERLNDLSGQMIGFAFPVLDTPGAGFLEKIHETASAFTVRAAGLSGVQQCAAGVYCCITSASPGRLRYGASQARQRFRNHLSAAPRSKNFANYADKARRCTPMHADSERLNDLSGQMIGFAFPVLDTPGAGFLEKIHETASAFTVRAAGLSVVQQCAAGVYSWNVVVRGDFVDPRAEDARPAALNTVKPLDDARMPRLLAPWVGCHAPMTARRPARSSARWSIPPSRARRPNAWRTTGEPHGPICVHLRASPCFICGKFFLVLPRHKRATRAEAAGDRSLSEPRPECAEPVRITVQAYWSSASPILWRRRDLLATLSGTIDGA